MADSVLPEQVIDSVRDGELGLFSAVEESDDRV
jgi:hypothetical protein